MITPLTSDSMSAAVIVVSFTVASGADAGSLFATGDGVTTAGAGVAAGLGAGRELAGRRGVCATTTTNNKAATKVARVSLDRFIRALFGLQRGPRRPRLDRGTIIFEEASSRQKDWSASVLACHIRQPRTVALQSTASGFVTLCVDSWIHVLLRSRND